MRTVNADISVIDRGFLDAVFWLFLDAFAIYFTYLKKFRVWIDELGKQVSKNIIAGKPDVLPFIHVQYVWWP